MSWDLTWKWEMRCVICGITDDDLVPLQEHVMREHGYNQSQLQNQTRRTVKTELREEEHYIYQMPDGKDWLDAKRIRREP